MSGVEAAIGLISGIIATIQAVKQISDNVQDAANLPEAFREVGKRLPVVVNTLQIAQSQIKSNADEETCQAMVTLMTSCNSKAEQLRGIFDAVARSPDASRIECYRKAVRQWSKGELVEVLAKNMIEDVRVLAMNRSIRAATEAQVAELLKAIEDLADIEPSLSDKSRVSQHHSGSGDNIGGNKYEGNASHYENFSGPAYFGAVTQHESKEDPLQIFLKCLEFVDMNSRLNDIDLAAHKTCDWLLRHETYRKWTKTNWALLWIKGKPGSGKSTLLRRARDQAKPSLNGKGSPLILSFFFHGRGHELQRTRLGFFRSLLYQVLTEVEDALPNLVAALRQWQHTAGKDHEEKQLKGFFELSLRRALETRPVLLFVDALDECGKDDAAELAVWFKSLPGSLPPNGLQQFRICFTSRHYPNLNLGGVPEIWVEEENRSDISTYVKERLSSFRVLTGSVIPDLITERAGGVFLWVHLMVKKVLKLAEERVKLSEIEALIRSVPTELEGLYLDLIQGADPRFLKLIQWVCFSTRPLSLAELRWGMIVDTDFKYRSLEECQSAEQYCLSSDEAMEMYFPVLGCGLTEVIKDTKTVQFIHQTVKDFFVDSGLSILACATQLESVTEISHCRLSRICLHYLEMEEIKRFEGQKRTKLMKEFPFLHYATTSWIFHARSVLATDLLHGFPWPLDSTVELWVDIYRSLCEGSGDCPPKGTTLLHAMSSYGLIEAVNIIKDSNPPIDVQDSLGQTPLSCAARAGHEAIVALLIDWRANIDIPDMTGMTPLAWAIEGGYNSVTELLLRQGAKVDFDYQYPVRDDYESLKVDFLQGAKKLKRLRVKELAKEVARLSMLAGGGVGVAFGAISVATLGGVALGWDRVFPVAFVALFALISVPQGIIEDKHVAVWRTPLTRAAELGDVSITRLLLEYQAVPNLEDFDGYTPLSRAKRGGHIEVVTLLS